MQDQTMIIETGDKKAYDLDVLLRDSRDYMKTEIVYADAEKHISNHLVVQYDMRDFERVSDIFKSVLELGIIPNEDEDPS